MASIIKVDRILDSTELGKVDIPGGVETTELIADTWKNVDGTENYKCRCWVNFDGATTPPTIRASGNVSSVTKAGLGNYTINFSQSLVDVNYVCSMNASQTVDDASASSFAAVNKTTNSVRIDTENSGGTNTDFPLIDVTIFR